MRGQMHHIDLTVSDLARSKPFYDLVLGFLGYRCLKSREEIAVRSLPIPGGVSEFAIRRAEREREHDRYAAGLHHFAWAAGSRADVGALHAELKAKGARILDAPADNPQYGTGYYAMFFADPDGLKLELCHYLGN